MVLIAVSNSEFIGYACFIVGAVVLLTGVAVGLFTSLKGPVKGTTDDAREKLQTARTALEVMPDRVDDAKEAQPGSDTAEQAAEDVKGKAAEARTAVQQVQDIISALPENLRFAGVLILIGTALMSVATIQFGGVSLF